MQFKVVILIAVLMGSLTACNRFFEVPNWSVDTAIPLINTEIDVLSRVKDSLFVADEEGVITLVYKRNLPTLTLDSLFQFPDSIFQTGFSLSSGALTFLPGQNLFSDTANTTLNIRNVKLTRALFNQGYLKIELLSTIEGETVIDYTIPAATKNGVPLSFSRSVPASAGGAEVVVIDSFDLSGYELSLRGKDNNLVNTLAVGFGIRISPNASSTVVTSGDYMLSKTQFVNAKPTVVSGSFETQVLPIEAKPEGTDIFRNFGNGSLDISEASINFEIENYVGVDFEVQFNDIKSIDTLTGNSISLTTTGGRSLFVPRATSNHQDFSSVQAPLVVASLSTPQFNIDELLEFQPNAFSYDISLIVNPLGNLSASNDFLFTERNLDVALSARIPLKFSTSGINIRDTSTFDFGTQADNEEWAGRISGGNLMVYVENLYPFHTSIQLNLLDANKKLLHKLVPDDEIASLPPGKGVQPIALNQAIISHLYNTQFMEIAFSINTLSQEITIRDTDRFKLKLVGEFEYDVKNE